MELAKANKVRVLAILTEKRSPLVPDIPTLKEQGVNASGLGMNRGIWAPAGIPEDARKVLEEAFFKFAKSEDYKKYHKDNMVTEGWMDGGTFGSWLEKRNEEYKAILTGMGLLKK